MADFNPRLRAVCDLSVAEMREYGGRHEYDGKVQDLSRDGVRAGLAALAASAAAGSPLTDEHDEAQLAIFERAAQVSFGDLELHRSNPYFHLSNLDLACYDRDYAPAPERDRARAEHLAAWPRAVDGAIDALDRVAAPVAQALVSGFRGLAAGIPADTDPHVRAAAEAAHSRLVDHLLLAAAEGSSNPALGGPALTALMGSAEGIELDLGRLAERADAERDRLAERLADSCARIDAGRPPLDVARELVRNHPDADGVIEAARGWTRRAIDFTRDANLVPYTDGECLVGPAPQSRRWAMAMMATAAPDEPEGPSWYHITPPIRPGPSTTFRNGLRYSATLRCLRSQCMRSLLGTFRMAGPSAGRRRLSAARSRPRRSSRAGRTTPRNSASRKASARTTPGSRSGSGLRP